MAATSDNPTDAVEENAGAGEQHVVQVIRNLEQSGVQIALVVADDRVLIGTMTDGDIRRGLLRNLDMNSSIETIVHRPPLVASPELGRETVLQIMRVNKINKMPIVDKSRRVVGLHVWDELMAPAMRSNVMVIMAGGKGQRFSPDYPELPQAAAPGRRQGDSRAHCRAGAWRGLRAFCSGDPLSRPHV